MKKDINKYNKAYKFRLSPNEQQIILLNKTFGSTRFVWNQILSFCKKTYEETKKTQFLQPSILKKDYEWLKESDSLAFANARINLQKAYKGFFRKISGFPKFKSKKDTKESYTTNNQNGTIRIESKLIKIPKIGFINFIQHRQIKDDEKIKSATVSRDKTGKYFISIIVEGIRKIEKIIPNPDKIVGLDYSMTDLFKSNEDEIANYPRYYRNNEIKLSKLNQSLHRKKKGSNNRSKIRVKLASFHNKIRNLRNDFLHKLSCRVANKYDGVIVEDINLQHMSRCLNFGKSIHDNGFGMFREFLKYKLEDRGKYYGVINKWFASSKLCSECGTKNNNLKLSDKIYKCINAACNLIINRDLNAAINIKTVGTTGLVC
ncbi:MAG: transposase [Anaplasmataceae bacterium]|nr:transposase [Anaplasmataceae bacterium]